MTNSEMLLEIADALKFEGGYKHMVQERWWYHAEL